MKVLLDRQTELGSRHYSELLERNKLIVGTDRFFWWWFDHYEDTIKVEKACKESVESWKRHLLDRIAELNRYLSSGV